MRIGRAPLKNWWLGVVQRNYKCAFNLTRFAAVWRRLLIFYIAMCLAGYAKSLHDLIFWPSFVVLVLLLWEPYASPPLTWVSGAEQAEVEVGKSKINTGSTKHCEKRMADDIKRWHWAIQDGINPTQMAAYMGINACIVAPTAALWAGAHIIIKEKEKQDNPQAFYSSVAIMILVTLYMACMTICMVIFYTVHYVEERDNEMTVSTPRWKPHDMMYFLCKILGETLNIVLQALVAGSFVEYMPDNVFSLCIAITGLSYTATNLLYDFDSNPPVGTEWQGFGLRDLRCCGQRAAYPSPFADPVVNQATSSNSSDHAPATKGTLTIADSAMSSLRGSRPAKPMGDAEGTQGCLVQAVHVPGDVQDNTVVAISDSNSSDGGSISSGQRPAQHPSPPFLKYNKPAGIRGWGIIVLLCAVLVPSVVLWGFVTHGLRTNQHHMFLNGAADKDNSCRNGKAFERCFKRYVAMLYLLGLCGVVSCYYALTVGVLASGPVTCMFRVCAAARMTKQVQVSDPELDPAAGCVTVSEDTSPAGVSKSIVTLEKRVTEVSNILKTISQLEEKVSKGETLSRKNKKKLEEKLSWQQEYKEAGKHLQILKTAQHLRDTADALPYRSGDWQNDQALNLAGAINYAKTFD